MDCLASSYLNSIKPITENPFLKDAHENHNQLKFDANLDARKT